MPFKHKNNGDLVNKYPSYMCEMLQIRFHAISNNILFLAPYPTLLLCFFHSACQQAYEPNSRDYL